MSRSCKHIAEFKETNLSEFTCLYSCLIACNSARALKIKATHSLCVKCKKTWKLHACMYCVFIGCYDEKHIHEHLFEKNHPLSVDLSHGYVYCFVCGDFMYDADLDKIATTCTLKARTLLGMKEPCIPWVASGCEVDLLTKYKDRRRLREDSYLGFCGLCDLGNTCYMNSLLQAMMHMPILREYFLSLKHCCQTPGKNVQEKPTCILCELSYLFQEFYSGKTVLITPSQFYYFMWDRFDRIRKQAQVDVHEFLSRVLNIMHESCLDSMDEPGNTDTDNRHTHSNRHTSIIDLIFNGRHQSDIICKVCNSVSSTVEAFWDVSLEISNSEQESDYDTVSLNGSSSGYTLVQCLEKYTSEENLTAEVHCNKCHMKRISTKQITFVTLPNILCFNLKRWKGIMVNSRKPVAKTIKIETEVTFPLILDMTQFLNCHRQKTNRENFSTLNIDRYKYRLFAVISHRGDGDSGHYVAYVSQFTNQWFECDNHMITSIALDKVLKLKGYLLFYHKETLEYE